MTTFEDVCKKIFSDPGIWAKLLIGIALSFVPILNLAALGYLRIYLTQIRETGDFALPSWKQSVVRLFMEGVYFFLIILFFALVPLIAAFALAWLFNAVTGGVLRALPVLWISPLLVLSPMLVAAANYRMGPDNWRNLTDLKIILGMVAASWRTLLIASLALWGLSCLFAPVWGVPLFVGMLLFYPYATLVYVYLEKRGEDIV